MIHNSYILNETKNIWIRPGFQGIHYSEGNEAENRLINILKRSSDLSVMSLELAQACENWSTTYHLSRKRSNLLRPFANRLVGKSILEIGAGCGAITRYLGETAGQVLALEGSPVRAHTAALRCRGLQNVHVVSDNFQSFKCEQKFDFVTLIGVLEYARSFVDGDDPTAIMLEKAKSYLKPNGVLIIAIENQLGLKYFAGYPEDHVGKPMFGIEGHYKQDGVVTFGKQQLSQQVAAAGLSQQQWWYPFPDYKMPNLLISEKGINPPDHFDLSTLIRSTCMSDLQTPDSVHFIQERAWNAVINNQLAGDLANSFVLLSSQQQHLPIPKDYAHHYAVERRPEFSKQVTFSEDDNNNVIAKQEKLYPQISPLNNHLVIQHLDNQEYTYGDSWQDELINILSTPGWSVDSIATWLDYWRSSFELFANKNNKKFTLEESIDSSLLDAIPRNLLRIDDKQFNFIDLEWTCREDISFEFMVFRAILSSLQSLNICALPQQNTPTQISKLIKELLSRQRVPCSPEKLEDWITQETRFQVAATGREDINLFGILQSHIRVFDTQVTVSSKLEAQEQHYTNIVKKHLEDKEAIYRSISWRITKPFRSVNLLLRTYLRKPKQVIRNGINIIKTSGGILSTTKKALSIYRTRGFSAFKQSLFMVIKGHNNYKEWVRCYDTLSVEQQQAIQTDIGNMQVHPIISVVMPVYNPTPEWLKEAIISVQNQLYPHWELCIADDLSTSPQIKPILKEFAEQDSRIKVIFRQENGHISAASNSALELVSGTWVALLDHDDLLPKHALYHVAKVINQHPDVQMIYSDEDKFDEQGNRYIAYFKPDWNPELFYSQNMFSHLGVYKTELINKVGGFRIGYEGSQDYDLALRCTEHVERHQIKHIPHVLYHWRIHPDSTAQSGSAKPYTVTAGEKALNDHLQRQGIKATATAIPPYGYRVKYELPNPLPLVSLLIPTKNSLDLTRKCINSILEKTTYTNFEIIIIDNGSDEKAVLEYFSNISIDPRISIHKDERPFNFSQLNNTAVKSAKGELLALVNNDIEVITPEWLDELVSHAMRPGIGAVGAKLLHPDDTIKHGGVILGLGGVAGYAFHRLQNKNSSYFSRAHLTSELSAVTAACLVVKKSIYEEVGGFNENELKVAFNDVDFCLKIKEAGYRNIYAPHATLYHHGSMTHGLDNTPEKQANFSQEIKYMQQTWGDLLDKDPAYNPNLTIKHLDFSLAWPPRIEKISNNDT